MSPMPGAGPATSSTCPVFVAGAQGPGPSAAALPGALAGSCIISEATGTQMGIHMGCQH